MMLILLLQATTFIQYSLLLRCGDIESNPGPGIYPGKYYTMFKHYCNNVIFISDLDYDDIDNSTILSKYTVTM